MMQKSRTTVPVHSLGEKIKTQRKYLGLSQEELAEKLHVSRQAITKWENNRGIPEIGNLIAICDFFNWELDSLIKDNQLVKEKLIADSASKKWHLLVIIYLLAVVIYIIVLTFTARMFMVGLLIATVFMLFYELRIFVKEKIYQQRLPKK
ncbi:helix-turn-helix domain-containing protein [Streptococcus chenjunshii]|nr:helix-turn-helix domain-containing protein [Streptococcus chenjunshii]